MDLTPTPDAAVRTARVEDAVAMGSVQADSWRAGLVEVVPPFALDAMNADDFAATWQASLERPPSPAHRALVATEGPDLVGLTAIGPAPDEGGEVLMLTVAPGARRRGHGSRLLNAAVDTLRANDFSEVCCWVPLADEATQEFLRGSGLAPDGAYRDRVIDDSHTLREVRLVAAIGES